MALPGIGADERHRNFQERFTTDTLVFLRELHDFNLVSRQVLARILLETAYTPLRQGQGTFGQLPPLQKRQLLNVVTLEILAKVFMALEDLGKILAATRRPLPEFPDAFITVTSRRALEEFARLARSADAGLQAAFPLWAPEQYGFQGDEATALRTYNLETVRVTRRLFAFLTEFVQRHRLAYERYKHGMPILLRLEGQPSAEGIDGLMAIFRRTSKKPNAGFMLTGPKVVERLLEVLVPVVDLSKILVDRRIQMAEFGGTPPPVLCDRQETADGATYHATALGTGNADLQRQLIPLFQRVLEGLTRTRIDVTLNVNMDRAKFDEWLRFYQGEWHTI